LTDRKDWLDMIAADMREAGLLFGVFGVLDALIHLGQHVDAEGSPVPQTTTFPALGPWLAFVGVVAASLIVSGMWMERVRPIDE
jgi:hypothetical protein